jgi:hypothetical protein
MRGAGVMAEKKDMEFDHIPDYLYGVVYTIQRPEGGNPDGS